MGGLVDGKVALVAGAGLGIGRDTCVVLAEEGATAVVVVDVEADTAAETARLVEQAGADARIVRADVSNEADVRRMVEETVAAYGRLDCACNNAGILGPQQPIHEISLADFERVLSVNLRGVFLGMKYELAQMLAQGGGAIVNTSSGAGILGVRGLGAYSASKHGIVGLTRTAGVEYAHLGIRVNAICPGAVDTTFHRTSWAESPWLREQYGDRITAEVIARPARPREMAEAVAWLCSDRASYVSGTAFPVDNGYSAQ
jgi:NAD(P)-dependent dehydrogenase (short-subunit alcohol dehydrogenase family)